MPKLPYVVLVGFSPQRNLLGLQLLRQHLEHLAQPRLLDQHSVRGFLGRKLLGGQSGKNYNTARGWDGRSMAQNT